jgi:hypothetical protein
MKITRTFRITNPLKRIFDPLATLACRVRSAWYVIRNDGSSERVAVQRTAERPPNGGVWRTAA